jgi:enoyl-CoA hydratase/carnithine racemase
MIPGAMRELVIASPAKNALSTSVLESLQRGLIDAGGEPVLLTGAGEVFSAGLDLKEVAALDLERARRLVGALEGMVEALFTYPAPTVALVNGHAIAGGCVLVMCCDLRVMTSDAGARIGLNEVALGLTFPPKTLAMLRSRLGASARERVLLGAQLYDPGGAREVGLVDETAPDARALAVERLEALSRHPPAGYARLKAELRRGVLQQSAEDRRAFEEELLPRWASAETRAIATRLLQRPAR